MAATFGPRATPVIAAMFLIILDLAHPRLDIWIKGKDALFQVSLAFKAEPPAHIRQYR